MTTDTLPAEPFYKVPASLFQAMASYMSHQPYRDVAPMLNATHDLMPQTDPAPELVLDTPAPPLAPADPVPAVDAPGA
ncbi:MAG: hypothetical protein ACTHOJ_17265 [Sphingomonas oligoaromativorans]